MARLSNNKASLPVDEHLGGNFVWFKSPYEADPGILFCLFEYQYTMDGSIEFR